METEDRKKSIIEKSAREFLKLDDSNKAFILGYMLGVQHKKTGTRIDVDKH